MDEFHCFACGESIEEDLSFCPHCGTELKTDDDSNQEDTSNNATHCANCGTLIAEEASFCINCGSEL